MHMEILELCFSLSFWIKGAKMGTELGNEFRVVREPWDVIPGGQERLEPIQRSSFEIGQGIGNLGTIIGECVGSVLQIKEALSQEGLQFLDVRSIEWVGLPDSGEGRGSFGIEQPIG